MRNLTGELNVMTNLSDHILTDHEYSALNKGLKFGFLSTHFDFLSTQASFEKLYQYTRPFFELER